MKKNKINIAKNIIKLESDSLKNMIVKINSHFDKACDAILSCKGKVVTIGLGKSGHIAAKASATLSSTGTPSMYIHGADCLHGDIGAIKKEDIIIFFSNSGETRELLSIISLLKVLKIQIISITGNKLSKLAKASDFILECGVKKEACPLNLTPTSSVITAISMSDALALTLLECRGFTSKDFARSHPNGSLGRRLLKKVSDIMSKTKLPIVSVESNLNKTIKIMSKFNYGVAVVLDKNKKIVGIFTDGDLRRTLQKYSDLSNLKIRDIMTKKPFTIGSDILAAEALNILESNEITSLLIKSNTNQLLGIITLNAILRAGIE
tara:strand:+ start:72 stop:1037 length:966 start_codon:yes stop_codon:yes gene_type:complete